MPTDRVQNALQNRWGFSSFRPGQREVIDLVLAGQSALAVLPTGGGKTLTASLPATLLDDGITLIVSPLLALMRDQVDALQRLGIAAVRLDTTLGEEETQAVYAALRNGEVDIVFVSPERLSNERFGRSISSAPIAMVVVDEAHSVSSWGHNFRPDYLLIPQFVRTHRIRRVLALTATATPQVQRDICEQFEIPPANAVVTSFARPNLQVMTSPTVPAQRDAVLITRIKERTPGTTIVYVTFQQTAATVAATLCAAGIDARAYHAGMHDDERHAVQHWWHHSDTGVVVATIAFGMGIDKPNVRSVYHYNLPKNVESWVQEIGRAGRDGLPAVVEMLGSVDDRLALENFVYGDTPTPTNLAAFVDAVLAAPTLTLMVRRAAITYDMRESVVDTALTYLVLQGVLERLTPCHMIYKVRFTTSHDACVAAFNPEQQAFLQQVFAAGKVGRIWLTLELDVVAAAIGAPVEKLVRTLRYLETNGFIETQSSGWCKRYRRVPHASDPQAICDDLVARFSEHELAAIARIDTLVEFVYGSQCVAQAMLAYFGEDAPPCGQCSVCQYGAAQRDPEPVQPPLDRLVDRVALNALQHAHPAALGTPEQITRFVCGLTSPRTRDAKLTKHSLFGVASTYPFVGVLAWWNSHQRGRGNR